MLHNFSPSAFWFDWFWFAQAIINSSRTKHLHNTGIISGKVPCYSCNVVSSCMWTRASSTHHSSPYVVCGESCPTSDQIVVIILSVWMLSFVYLPTPNPNVSSYKSISATIYLTDMVVTKSCECLLSTHTKTLALCKHTLLEKRLLHPYLFWLWRVDFEKGNKKKKSSHTWWMIADKTALMNCI